MGHIICQSKQNGNKFYAVLPLHRELCTLFYLTGSPNFEACVTAHDLADKLTGLDFNPSLEDKVTLYVFLGAFTISLYLNLRDSIRKKSDR